MIYNESTEASASLLPQHVTDLRKSGLTDATIRACGFQSLTDPEQVRQVLGWNPPYRGELGPCLAIPFRDVEGNALDYFRLKPDRPRRKAGKLVKYESPKGSSSPPYFPPGTLDALKDPTQALVIVEGEKKAAKADQEGLCCIGLVGVYGWQKCRPRDENGKGKGNRELIDGLASIPWQGRTVVLCFDSDAADNLNVLWGEWHLAQALAVQEAVVKIVRLPSGGPGPDGKPVKVGLDDYLVAQGPEAFRRLLELATEPTAPARTGSGRPSITITTEEHEVNAKAAEALARDPAIYQRGSLLVRVVRDVSPAAKEIRRPFAPRIEALPPSLLRERLAAAARWLTIKGTEKKPARPPGWCVAAVHARADWPGIPHLEAVVDYPVLRPDGTILDRPGYDPETGLLLESLVTVPAIPDRPSWAEAVAARDILLAVVADFPFERPPHRASWLASLLTPLARFAFTGPAPLFLVDANVRGAGKGLLLHCNSQIVTGDRFTVAAYTADEDELRKRITSLVLAGDRLVLFDNLEGKFGNAVLDAALTGTTWKDRVLGVNRMAEAPLYMTWYATGNNVAIAADTARRVCHIRLESPDERPEERSKFQHPDLLAWVGANRGQLLASALTILRAYCAAGRPDLGLPAWGSFEGWSRLVRSAVVWVDLPDPGETRLLLQESADVTAECMSVLLECWEEMDPMRKGLTAAEAVQQYKQIPDPQPEWHADYMAALEMLLGKPDTRSLGTKLRSYRRRIFGGRFFDRVGEDHRAIRWGVFPATAFRRRTADTRADSSHSPGTGHEPEDGVSVTTV
jgi:hypothetical protein